MKIQNEHICLLILIISLGSVVMAWFIGRLLGLTNPVELGILVYGYLSIFLMLPCFLIIMRNPKRGRFYKKPTHQENEIELNVRIGHGPWVRRCVQLEGNKLMIIDRNLTDIDLSPLRNHPNLVLLDLSLNRLEHINLEALGQCRELSILNLTSNELVTVDLRALSNCPKLKYLDLSNNRLIEIDLESLSSCPDLDTLDLGGNFFGSIELDALSSCSRMECLTIDATNLETLDLSPLESCKNLEHLILNQSRIRSLDITPLFNCEKLDLLEIDGIELIADSAATKRNWPRGILDHRDRVKLLSS